MKFQIIMLVWFFVITAVTAAYTIHNPVSQTYGFSALFCYKGTAPNDSTYINATAEVIFETEHVIRVRLVPEVTQGQKTPYSVPDVVIPGNNAKASATQKATTTKYDAGVFIDQFGERFLAVTDPTKIMDFFSVHNLTFEEQLVQFSTTVPGGSYLSGYGEHDYYYFINHNTSVSMSLWNTDNGTPWLNPMYGVHPVVFVNNPVMKLFYAFVWINSNAQSLKIDGTQLTFTSIGGTVNVFVIVGDSPYDVLQRYHTLIGTSHVPPYWALGTHQCRWGYHNISETAQVVAKYKAAFIPLETMWNDIDYMQDFRVFTLDPDRFPVEEVKAFVEQLHNSNQHYMQIIDPGVATQYNYSVFESGLNQSVFMTLNGEPLVGAVWPGWTAFPDFTDANAAKWWEQNMADYFQNVDLGGMWIDMNEASSFCAGSCPVPFGTKFPVNWATVNWATLNDDVCLKNGCTSENNLLNFPPLNPLTNGNNLTTKTQDMNADLAMGKYYDTKAFYGLMEAKATYDALLAIKGTRPFIVSRASYVGAGRYTAHWTGDNSATWTPQAGGIGDSIQGVLSSNLWGISMIGADIGGFGGSTTPELITRWYQLGVYYTFTRNHNDLTSAPQEPYVFSDSVQDAIRDAINDRYRLLPYLFTELLRSYVLGGPVLMHPSIMFPLDEKTYIECSNFMFGRNLMVLPVVEQGATTVKAYLPEGTWFALWNGTMDAGEMFQGGLARTFDAPLYGRIPVLLKEGAAIPLHVDTFLTVKHTRESGIAILCALNENGSAAGEFWNDDMKDSPISKDGGELLRRSYDIFAFNGSGWVKSLAVSGPTPAVSLGTAATITIFFRSVEEAKLMAHANFTLSTNATFVPSITVAGRVVTLALPTNVDGSSVFELRWGSARVSGTNGLAAGYIVLIVAGSVVVIGAVVAAVLFFKKSASPDGVYKAI